MCSGAGPVLTGPDGLLKQLAKTVLETALDRELTENTGQTQIEAPRALNVNLRRRITQIGRAHV